MTKLRELTHPRKLSNHGFEYTEAYEVDEDYDYDPDCRSIWFRKKFDRDENDVRVYVDVEFEISVSDEPYCSSEENIEYFFNGCYMTIYDRQIGKREKAGCGNNYEDSEDPYKIGRVPLHINTLTELLTWCKKFE